MSKRKRNTDANKPDDNKLGENNESSGKSPAKRKKWDKGEAKPERKAWPADQTWSKSKKKRMRAIKSKSSSSDTIDTTSNETNKNDIVNDAGKKPVENAKKSVEVNKQSKTTPTKKLKKDSTREMGSKKPEEDTTKPVDVSQNSRTSATKNQKLDDTKELGKKSVKDDAMNSVEDRKKAVKERKKAAKDRKKTANKTIQVLTKEQSSSSPRDSNGTSAMNPAAVDDTTGTTLETTITTTTTKKQSSSLQSKFKERLLGSRFRILNEELYTTTSATAFERFRKNPSLFVEYHDGFRHQVQDWPTNPVNVIVRRLRKKLSSMAFKKDGGSSTSPKLVIADFGCGEAQLAKDLMLVSKKIQSPKKGEDKSKKSKQTNADSPFVVHSFDLVSPNEYVTACDMSNVPLPSNTVDVGIFCLSLMGTNIADFIREAYRVVKDDGGELIIAEVRSRFETSAGDNELKTFTDVLDKLGFQCKKIDRSNQLFMVLELQKKKIDKIDTTVQFTAKPCIYKRR